MKFEIYAPAQDKVLSSFDKKDVFAAYKRFNTYAIRRYGDSITDETVFGGIKWLLPATKKLPEMEIVLRTIDE